ncbi:helix-turn-helix domain-containing protein [Kibdelosporangium persicum]|uniref:Transcriptional regulator n=1 Tax=Kibdelosporangium persicum TaxID=2698649 RepID=A0ABX2FB69_9PSEU|nr:helix-turn-helix domain-containing protein [Kibdelosporangium persicum]NRN68165.1 Transcriptional regulator [Kibdelosporangium persicum]
MRRYSCPVEFAVDTLGGKWAVVILAQLKEGSSRYGELRRLIPGITEKMLTQRLRELEAAGLVERTVESGLPLAVSYSLADDSLRPVLQALYDWGGARAAQVGAEIEPPARR